MLIKRIFTREFIRFAMVGVFNTIVSWLISTYLFDYMDYTLAFIIGYLVPMVISYFLNCIFTFKSRPTLKSMIKFPLSYIPNFLIQYIFLTIGVKVFMLPESITLLCAQVVAFPITFLVMKMVVFLKGKAKTVLAPATIDDFDGIYAIMQDSFPPTEIRTKDAQGKLFDNENYNVYIHGANKKISGFIAFWTFDKFRFLEHFAVAPSLRGQGIGKAMLKEFCELSKVPVFLEVEPPETMQAKRRISFYENSGFYLNEYTYEQPSMQENQPAIPLMVMSYPSPISQKDFSKFKKTVYEHVYHKKEG